MASASMTPYELSIITRWVKVNAKDAMKDCKMNEDGEISKRTPGDFEVSYELQWNDDDEQEVWCWVYTHFTGRKNCLFRQKFYTAEKMIEDLIAELKGKTYKHCKMPNCWRIAAEDDQCEDCYVHDWHRGENCCVCLEDGGHWVSMDCEHIIHRVCFLSMTEMKCPLCRAPTSSPKDVKF